MSAHGFMNSILLSPADAESDLAKSLEQEGLRVLAWPELRINEPENNFSLDEAIENLFGYDWLIFKNERAAAYFLRRLKLNHEVAELDDLKILAIGDDASQVLAQAQVHVDVFVDRSTALITALEHYVSHLNGMNFLVPSATVSRETFEQQLEDAGARVDSVVAYQTVADTHELAQVSALLIGGGADAILFTSRKLVIEFAAVVDTDDLGRVLKGMRIICRDAETFAAATEFGLDELMVGIEAGALAEVLNR